MMREWLTAFLVALAVLLAPVPVTASWLAERWLRKQP